MEVLLSLLNHLFIILCMLSFFISGVILNLIQFIAYITIGNVDIKLYRKLNYYFIYSSWSQLVAVSEWWSGSTIATYFDDEESRKAYANSHAMVVMNHRYELDWLWSWMFCDKYGCLGNAKSFAKKSLRFLPVIGWGWVLDEFIFLERNWEKDSQNLGKSMDKIMSYEDPISLLLFAEGTRFTQKKYELSMDFARQRNLPQLKYHLLPRIKGFAYCIRHIKQNYPDVTLYNTQIRFENGSQPEASLRGLMDRTPFKADMYFHKIPLNDVPTDSDDNIAKFLYDMYEKKDELMEYHEKNGKFPGIRVDHKRRVAPLLNWLGWLSAVVWMLFYGLLYVFTSESWLLIVSTNIILIIALISIHFMIRSTEIKKGSKYGVNKANANNNTNNYANESVRTKDE